MIIFVIFDQVWDFRRLKSTKWPDQVKLIILAKMAKIKLMAAVTAVVYVKLLFTKGLYMASKKGSYSGPRPGPLRGPWPASGRIKLPIFQKKWLILIRPVKMALRGASFFYFEIFYFWIFFFKISTSCVSEVIFRDLSKSREGNGKFIFP